MRVSGVFCFAVALVLVASGMPAAAQSTIVKFTLDWKFEGQAAPFLVALDKGFFTAEGLDVSIEQGNGSIEPITRVATGGFDLGFGDINALIKYRDQNPANGLRPIFMVYNRPPFSIVSRKSRGVTAPKDLEGKKLGAPTADGAFAQWPIFVQANGIDASKVVVENVGFPVREPMLAAGQVDAIAGFSFTSYITLKDRGVPVDDIVLMLMADYGVKLYGNAILVNAKFAAEKPEAVKAFLRAFLKGLKESVRDPRRAVESVLTRNEIAKRDTELERLRMAIKDNILTPEVKEHGLGVIDPARLQAAIDQIGLTYKFKNKPQPTDVFDPSYLPPDNELRAH